MYNVPLEKLQWCIKAEIPKTLISIHRGNVSFPVDGDWSNFFPPDLNLFIYSSILFYLCVYFLFLGKGYLPTIFLWWSQEEDGDQHGGGKSHPSPLTPTLCARTHAHTFKSPWRTDSKPVASHIHLSQVLIGSNSSLLQPLQFTTGNVSTGIKKNMFDVKLEKIRNKLFTLNICPVCRRGCRTINDPNF